MTGAVQVTLQYFDGCPNWQACRDLLAQALRRLGQPETALTLQAVTTAEDAEAVGFRGSPTVLIDGSDPFADPSAPVGLSCRVFRTPDGLAGSPTLEQLMDAMTARGLGEEDQQAGLTPR